MDNQDTALELASTVISWSGYLLAAVGVMRPLQKGLFLPPALFANTHLLLNKLRFAA